MVVLGFLPFIGWEIFATIYYGFPFPNTAYAKLNNWVSSDALLKNGFLYLKNSLLWDPITLTVILSGAVSAFIRKNRAGILLGVGALLYVFYIVKIGGDFMSGRFLSGPFLIGVILLSNGNSR